MTIDYQTLEFAYRASPDQACAQAVEHPVVVVGAGPVGLSVAIDLAQQGTPVVLLDDDHTLSSGSRAICFAKRTLEIWDRLGCGDRMTDKGVRWNVGKVFLEDGLVYEFNLQPEEGHERPAFINLQQYYAEGYLFERAAQLPGIDLRWRNKVVSLDQDEDGVRLGIETPDGPYALRARYVVAADGSRSPLRGLLGQESKGRVFRDRFLIADVKMKADFPTERWFWFDPPFHRGQSVLLHRQPDNVWRIDFQLGWEADPQAERAPERVIPRVQALLGPDVAFELEWVSVYTFACLRMDRFRHGRVLFAGDSAHGVSPFGARGANSGVQDAENLAWKLRLVLAGQAPDRLLDTYDIERVYAADENILNSTRATDFITPKSDISRVFRDAVLQLARTQPFARRLVNSGRLSVPAVLRTSVLNSPDDGVFAAGLVAGAPASDAPVRVDERDSWLLRHLGDRFTLLCFAPAVWSPAQREALAALANARAMHVVEVGPHEAPVLDGATVLQDARGLAAQRYDAQPGTVYLLRPDQHVCARQRTADAAGLDAAWRRATCND